MINKNKKFLKMALLGMSVALAPTISTAAGSCGSYCLTEARNCISEGNSSSHCFSEYETCMIRNGCPGWA
ncbi:hypothetical protein [Thalassomonas actiniarum]|uniref:Lipoprotein n=1 Tax=Thalassomonas actiniarum TaxID=485447 RepID=A0AAF0C1W2_9GAMM|nr:hypothetical protein [Thalassomonas actiniarum]WDD99426.1 hypothetical protein SG35_001700 [Thalassomonas actiniarum]